MISLVTLFAMYIAAALVGKSSGHNTLQTRVLLALIALVQVVVVLVAMFLMDPPSMVKGGH
jgi:hypothetical protein